MGKEVLDSPLKSPQLRLWGDVVAWGSAGFMRQTWPQIWVPQCRNQVTLECPFTSEPLLPSLCNGGDGNTASLAC